MIAAQTVMETPAARPQLAAAFRRLPEPALIRHFHVRATPRVACMVDPNEAGADVADGVLNGRFAFNHETHVLGAAFDWRRNPSRDIEWHILLHKFYYAPALTTAFTTTGDPAYLDRWVALTQSWIDQDIPEGFIAADVTGRRIQNWTYAFQGAFSGPAPPRLPAGFVSSFLASLEAQTCWLLENLHANRNHRTLELFAILLCAVTFPEFDAAPAWRSFAVDALARNAFADFRADGGHCEQSSHYHCVVLRNFLYAVRILRDNNIDAPAPMLERLRRAAHFAARLHRPDGEIPALSDADGGAHLDLVALAADIFGDAELAYLASRGARGAAPAAASVLFRDSGYAIMRSAWPRSREAFRDARYLIFDCGPLGDGNHGHFDLHSIEAYAYGRPLIVDPGRYTYDESGPENWRARFRATEAHSTVEVDGRNQVRYEAGPKKMKVRGQAPDCRVLEFAATPDGVYVHSEAIIQEYGCAHHRRILFVDDAFWVVADDLIADGEHVYRLRYQLTPDAADDIALGRLHDFVQATASGLDLRVYCDRPSSAQIEPGWVSRRYGQKAAAPRICIKTAGRNARFVTVIAPRPPAARRSIDVALVDAAPDALCLRIRNGRDAHVILIPPVNGRSRATAAAMRAARMSCGDSAS